jgi:hypothetical protein
VNENDTVSVSVSTTDSAGELLASDPDINVHSSGNQIR